MKKTTYRCASNIALVKYWGKRPVQLPANPSISFVLSNAFTETKVTLTDRKENALGIDFYFEGRKAPKFESRVYKYLVSISEELGLLHTHDLIIESVNSFPHSSGIASSASSMGALAMCLVDLELALKNESWSSEKLQFASHLARLGSGSASRSLFPQLSSWGKHDDIPESSDKYGTSLEHILHPNFHDYRDSILIISSGEKSVSSTQGHALMDIHPYASCRYKSANNNISTLLNILKTGDLERFISIVEHEAMALHGLMMMSDPSFILLHPSTLTIIDLIRNFREETGIPICFTLDAGPNVHLLYPARYMDEVEALIDIELKPYCEQSQVIHDCLGKGPKKMS